MLWKDAELLAYKLPTLVTQGRLLTRFLQEFDAGALSVGARYFGGNIDRYVVFSAAARYSGPLAAIAAGQRDPFETASKRISVNAIAASTYRPFETIRRHVNALIADGLAERDAGGVMVPARVLRDPGISAMLGEKHDWLVRLLEDMRAAGIVISGQQTDTSYSRWSGIVATLDTLLTALEFHAARHASWTELFLIALTSVGNTHAFLHDPRFSRTHLDYDDLAPRHLRHPVTVRALTNALGISYSTALRHVGAMRKEGMIVRERGGLITADSYITSPRVIADMSASAKHKMKILARLGSLGFPFDRPADAYITGRPAWLDL